MFLGIDIGSSSSKAALMDDEMRLAAVSVVNLGTGTRGPDEAVKQALEQASVRPEDVRYTVATGYGRILYETAQKQITEITCHAKGVSFLTEHARTIVDIGGQDAKVIRLSENGKVENFVMNEKCAAGTGRFLEVMARVLGCGLEELSALAEKSTEDIAINNVCTVFAESEVISRLSAGESAENVARGAHIAIAKRVAGMCSRVGFAPRIVMTGGVALNTDMVYCLSRELNSEIQVAPHSQAVGAIGAALFAQEGYNKIKEKELWQ